MNTYAYKVIGGKETNHRKRSEKNKYKRRNIENNLHGHGHYSLKFEYFYYLCC